MHPRFNSLETCERPPPPVSQALSLCAGRSSLRSLWAGLLVTNRFFLCKWLLWLPGLLCSEGLRGLLQKKWKGELGSINTIFLEPLGFWSPLMEEAFHRTTWSPLTEVLNQWWPFTVWGFSQQGKVPERELMETEHYCEQASVLSILHKNYLVSLRQFIYLDEKLEAWSRWRTALKLLPLEWPSSDSDLCPWF